ncbi:MAG: tetratricopeptide repeat protein [Leptospiraceae bacterium]|nr:tetratricopeptide repeat protein [Leptospiraceae bacterium]
MALFLRLFLISFIIFQLPLFAGIKEAKKAYAQKQFQKAIKLFSEYSKESPSDGEPYLFMGYIYESQKDFPRSMAMFRRAVELNLNPKQRKTCYLKIILFYNYHQGWDIVAHYSNKFLKLDPTNKLVSKMRDRAYANKGHDPGTLSFAKPDESKPKQKKNSEETDKPTEPKEKVKEPNPEPKPEITYEKPEKKTTKEEKKWELSLKHFKEEDYTKADKIMQELLTMKPTNKNYLYKAGIAKLRLGEYQKAIQFFESSKKYANENDSMLLYYINLNQGQANQKLGKTNTAIQLYKTAYTHNKSPVILPVLTKLYYESSLFEDTIKTAEEILKSDLNHLEANMYKALAQIMLGKKTIGYKNLLEFTKKINRVHPDINTIPEKFHEGLLQTGLFYSNRAKYKIALKYLTLVSSTKAKSRRFNFSLGKTYFYTRKFELAIVFLEKIPEVSAANYLLAKYYASRNNVVKSKEYLQKAATKKEIYWLKPKVDPYFIEIRKSPEFISFIETKGFTLPTKTEPLSVKEVKNETIEVPPQNSKETPKEPIVTQPTQEPNTSIPSTPVTNKTED